MADPVATEPLLPRPRGAIRQSEIWRHFSKTYSWFALTVKRARAGGRQLLASRKKHYVVMGLVVIDVAALLLNIVIQLIACEMGMSTKPWVENSNFALETLGLVISCLFMAELVSCLFCFGLGYLGSTFHMFDSIVIVLSFIVDISTRGIAARIGALIVGLRLWRLAKLSEEIIAGAAERIDDLEQRNQELSDQVDGLKARLGEV